MSDRGWIPGSLPPEAEEMALVLVSGRPEKNIELLDACELAEWDGEEGWILEMWPEWKDAVVSYWHEIPRLPEDAKHWGMKKGEKEDA